MSKKKILIIEDEHSIAEVIALCVQKIACEPTHVVSAEEAFKLLDRNFYDLILLDLMLPEMDGLDFCKNYRNNTQYHQAPIIMITARSDDADIVSGIEFGADDYVTKPFSPRVLSARIKARLRDRDFLKSKKSVVYKGIYMNPETHEASVDNVNVKFTANEFFLLYLFISNLGRVYSRDNIIEHLHGPGYPVTDRAIDVQIVGLRKKMGAYADSIEAVRGVGYKISR